jgi:hypothetical protein
VLTALLLAAIASIVSRVRGALVRSWWLVVAVCCAACGENVQSSAVQELRSGTEANGEAKTDQQPLPRDAPPEQVLVQAAKRYAPGLVAIGSVISGTLAQGTRSDHLVVLESGHCYRVVGVGGDGVDDMDLFLYDPAGVQANQDASQDRYPVLGMQSEICPIRAGAYRLQVQMYQGGGPFAVGVYRTQ